MKIYSLILMFPLLALTSPASASQTERVSQTVLLNMDTVQRLGLQAIVTDGAVGITSLDPIQMREVLEDAHAHNRCAGFELLGPTPAGELTSQEARTYDRMLTQLDRHVQKDANWSPLSFRNWTLQEDPIIDKALSELSVDQLRSTIQWLSSYPDRYAKSSNPNIHVLAMQKKLQDLLKDTPWAHVDLIHHQRTDQETVRVHLDGLTHPNEIVVLGAHLDSINQSWWGDRSAPGADDDASGAANILDALRVMIQHGQPQRSVEFFWYAAEEEGLVGSAEIAQDYKAAKKDVVAVLQLDMTAYPGDGDMNIGSMTDYTSVWLRDFLVAINDTYLHQNIVEDQCGYGCSDHASWYRQGYPTVIPFEATFDTMNHNLHTANDLLDDRLSMEHSLEFSKIALVFAMQLGNSQLRQPY